MELYGMKEYDQFMHVQIAFLIHLCVCAQLWGPSLRAVAIWIPPQLQCEVSCKD